MIKHGSLLFIVVSICAVAYGQDAETKNTAEKIFSEFNVDKKPEPEGGMEGFFRELGKNLKYPAEARRNGIAGKVVVYLIIDTNGKIIESGISSGIGSGCDEAALDAIKDSNIKWVPGVKGGKSVTVKIKIPITFSLG